MLSNIDRKIPFPFTIMYFFCPAYVFVLNLYLFATVLSETKPGS